MNEQDFAGIISIVTHRIIWRIRGLKTRLLVLIYGAGEH